MDQDHITTRMGAPQDYLPAKAWPNNGESYVKGAGGFTQRIANFMLDQLPAFTSSSILHDNGCGPGSCTMALMKRPGPPPPAGFKIVATDLSPGMTPPLVEAVREHGWPVEIAHMPAQKLTFPDDTFSHSVSSLIVQYTPNDGKDAARELFRTLKPGGTAVANCFAALPHWVPFKKVYEEQKGAPMPMTDEMMYSWFSGEKLRNAFVEAGFDEDKVVMKKFDAPMLLKDCGDGNDWDHFATFMWSSMGSLTGWTKADEDKWDDTIAKLAKTLSEMPEVGPDGEGGVRYTVPMNIVVATK
jgi:ubiquinone/menaquinone biosynthesis C-methylase UbiE